MNCNKSKFSLENILIEEWSRWFFNQFNSYIPPLNNQKHQQGLGTLYNGCPIIQKDGAMPATLARGIQ